MNKLNSIWTLTSTILLYTVVPLHVLFTSIAYRVLPQGVKESCLPDIKSMPRWTGLPWITDFLTDVWANGRPLFKWRGEPAYYEARRLLGKGRSLFPCRGKPACCESQTSIQKVVLYLIAAVNRLTTNPTDFLAYIVAIDNVTVILWAFTIELVRGYRTEVLGRPSQNRKPDTAQKEQIFNSAGILILPYSYSFFYTAH